MRDWIEQVLRFLHLPSLEFMNRQRELGRRISEAEARIRRLKQEKLALEDGTFELALSVPAKTAAVIPGLYSPPTSSEELPSLVERRRQRHSDRMDAAEALALRAENRIHAGRESAARANLGAMEELVPGSSDDKAITSLIKAIDKQIP